MMNHHSRRDFMRLSCCSAAGVSLLGGLSKFGLVSALAQGATDYKALVCIFMFGGNDSNNMIVPIDSRYTGYQQARAVLANVGTLVQPTTQQAYQQYTNLPENLYSHSDQQDQWQSAQLTGTPNAGWAGKVADKVQSSFNSAAQFPPVLSVSGSTVFSTGDVTRPFTMNPGQTPGLQGFDSSAASQARFLATQQLLTFDNGLSLVQSANSVTSQAVQYSVVLANALKNIAPLQTTFPNNYLGDQLKQVAQVIATRSAL